MESPLTGLTQGDFTLLRVLDASGVMTDILTLIGSAGGGTGTVTSAILPLSISNGVIEVDLSAYSTTVAVNNAILVAIGAYTTTSNLNALLGLKQDVLTPGTNITISNNVISASGGGSGTVLQLDGTTQNASVLNFVGYDAVLSGTTLDVSRMAWQDKVVLRYGVSSDLDLSQATSGVLTWGGPSISLRHSTGVTQTLTVDP